MRNHTDRGRRLSYRTQIAVAAVAAALSVSFARTGDWFVVAVLVTPLPTIIGPSGAGFRRWSERLGIVTSVALGPWSVLEMLRFGYPAAVAIGLVWIFGLAFALYLSRRRMEFAK